MTPRHYDWLIVGAGLSGAVLAERLASQADRRVLVIDRRKHLGGNVYDERDEHGLLCHRYGPHIFHTNSEKVVGYLSAFTEWRPYAHKVLAEVDGKLLPMPFNLNSLDGLLPAREATRLSQALIRSIGHNAHVPVLTLMQSEDRDLRELAEIVYSKIILGYTLKQWGLPPEALDRSVIDRVPIRVSRENRYFLDSFQQMPSAGYTAMVQRMLTHPKIALELDTGFAELGATVSYDRLAYTGAIDELFGHCYGALPYRSLQFEFRTHQIRQFQEVAQINYPGPEPYTRIVEMRHLTGEAASVTTVAIETPEAHRPGANIAYYPILTDPNRALHRRYLDLAEQEAPTTLFLGRLADYRYYNMDQAVARALMVFERAAAPGFHRHPAA